MDLPLFQTHWPSCTSAGGWQAAARAAVCQGSHLSLPVAQLPERPLAFPVLHSSERHNPAVQSLSITRHTCNTQLCFLIFLLFFTAALASVRPVTVELTRGIITTNLPLKIQIMGKKI